MATTISKLNFLIGADASGVRPAVAAALHDLKGLTTAAGAGGAIAGLTAGLASGGLSLAVGAIASVSSGIYELGKNALTSAAQTESLATQFEVMLGSAEQAKTMMAEIKDFAGATPFATTDLSDSAKTLMSFGVEAADIMPTLKMLGDVSMGNKEKLSSLALAFGQVQSQGKLMGGDLMQMINASFNPLQVMSEATGKSMAELKKQMSEGGISAEMVAAAFEIATSEGGMFFQGMEKGSKTMEGLWSTFTDETQDLIRSLGEEVEPIIKDLIVMLIDEVKWWKEALKSMKEFFTSLRVGWAEMKRLTGMNDATSGIKAFKKESKDAAADLKAMFAASADGATTSMKEEAANLKNLLATTKTDYDKLRDSIRNSNPHVGAVERHTAAGFSAVNSGRFESGITSALQRLEASERAALARIEERLKEVNESIKNKEAIQVKEVRI